MQIISGTTDFQLNSEYAVTIGKFDGIHRGHRELIDRILAKQESGLKAAVFTFDVSPLSFFAGSVVPGLTTNEEKRRIFDFLGIDTLIEFPLNEETAKIAPERFVSDILCKQMNMKYIAVGSDITFGYKGTGNAELLRVMSTEKYSTGRSNCHNNETSSNNSNETSSNNSNETSSNNSNETSNNHTNETSNIISTDKNQNNNTYKAGADDSLHNSTYTLEVVDKLVIDGEEVSSSLIRSVVASGNMEKAAKLIGVPYAVSGVVSEGRKLGRRIGFPTVNLEVPKDKMMPPNGVYFTEVSVDGKHLHGITNVGTKPTVTSSGAVFVETHIFDFNGDIYGKRITVKLLHFERPEQKFPSVDALKGQISSDVKCAEKYFSNIVITHEK